MAYYSDDDGPDLEPDDDEFDDEDGCPGCGAGFDEDCEDDCPLDDGEELEED